MFRLSHSRNDQKSTQSIFNIATQRFIILVNNKALSAFVENRTQRNFTQTQSKLLIKWAYRQVTGEYSLYSLSCVAIVKCISIIYISTGGDSLPWTLYSIYIVQRDGEWNFRKSKPGNAVSIQADSLCVNISWAYI